MNAAQPFSNLPKNQLLDKSPSCPEIINSGKYKLTTSSGKLNIGGQQYINAPENLALIRRAIEALPAPIKTIQQCFNEEIYSITKMPNTPDYFLTIHQEQQHKHLDLQEDNNLMLIGGTGTYKFQLFDTHRDLSKIPRDPSARFVSQCEVGFSGIGRPKIGTDNVQNCIAVIIQDKSTREVALAHVSSTYLLIPKAKGLIKTALEGLPEGEKKIIMMGGRYTREANCVATLENIICALANYPHTITVDHSYLFDDNHVLHEEGSGLIPITLFSCYETNTNCGSILVDPETLDITPVIASGPRAPESRQKPDFGCSAAYSGLAAMMQLQHN